MKTPSLTRLALVALAFLIAGCATIQSYWPFRTKPPPPTEGTRLPPVTAPAPPPPPPSNLSGATRPRRKRRHKKASVTPASTGIPIPSGTNPPGAPEIPVPEATPTPSSNVTMEGNDDGRAQAETLLDGANTRLAHIDRSKLSGDTSAAFQQATGLASAAHKAIDQGDYLAASGLARKASTLADQVAARVSSQ